MRVALDYDKTYDSNPGLFNTIAARFQVAGHEVGIITARHKEQGCELSFTPDFLVFLDCGELSYAERAIKKADFMKKSGVDLIFDDRAAYFPSDTVALNIL